MKLNEKGAALTAVLLALMVFSVLGLALMANVVNENKRVNVTEDDMQALNLAENGLTYFVSDFENYAKTTDSDLYNVNEFLSRYRDFQSVGDVDHPQETKVKAERQPGDDMIKVTSIGTDGTSTKTLVGYYQLTFDPIYIMPNFSGKAIDFSQKNLVGLNLLNLLNLQLVNTVGHDQNFYPVPNDSLIDVSLIGDLVDLNLGIDRFETMRENQVLATRSGAIVRLNLIKDVVNLDLLSLKDKEDTNVVINGMYTVIGLLGIKINMYKDIDFKRLAVIGNTVIQTANDKPRRFTFDKGLYVNKSLVIGDSKAGISKLDLHGNVTVRKNLLIKNVDLEIGNRSKHESIYVQGDAHITNACINKAGNENNDFRLIAKGKIVIEANPNRPECNTYNGFFYAENGIEIQSSDQPININGGIIGRKIDPNHKLIYHLEPEYLDEVIQSFNKVIPKGRTF